MPTQIVMDQSGDTRHKFHAKDAKALKAAEERFKELTGLGFTAAERTGAGEAKVVRAFDGNAKEVVFYPRLKGG